MKGTRLSDTVKTPHRLIFRVHALRQMFNRKIGDTDVHEVVQNGKIIEEYPDDTPYSSYLLLETIKGRPLHVVVGYNKEEGVLIVITAYEPDPHLWEENYTRRRS